MAIPTTIPSEITTSPEMERLQRGRFEFTRELLTHGLVSLDFIESGALDQFALDPAKGSDRLKHILIGDSDGGAHHLRTILELGIPGREIASNVEYLSAKPDAPRRQDLKQRQQLNAQGTYRPMHIVMEDQDGTTEKIEGSTMFPDTWDTQRVLEAIIETARVPGAWDETRNSTTHIATINNVKMQVSTDTQGKIITASPRRST